jgi:prepilin-type processing-associated H-X9-DG protein
MANAVPVFLGTCPSSKPGNNCNFSPQAGGLGSGATLGGWHAGFFQVAFADGSVRVLKLGLDQSLLLSLAGYNDGDPIVVDF